MPNFTNSFITPAERHRCCTECDSSACRGTGKLNRRRYTSWNDLASHLSEDEIVSMVNRLVEIEPTYDRLWTAEQTRKAAQAKRAALLVAAERYNIAPKPTITTAPMRSRQHNTTT